jgi:hypothetical protein
MQVVTVMKGCKGFETEGGAGCLQGKAVSWKFESGMEGKTVEQLWREASILKQA